MEGQNILKQTVIYLKGLNKLEILGSYISLQTKRIEAEYSYSYEAEDTCHISIQTNRKCSNLAIDCNGHFAARYLCVSHTTSLARGRH
jgi:hypothetical protein